MSHYSTVAVDLIHVAERAEVHFLGLGYRVDIEPSDLAYPYTPVLRLRRRQTTIFVEIDNVADMRRLGQWAAFCRSQSSDYQIVLAVPPEAPRQDWEGSLRNAGVGLCVCAEPPFEAIHPQDLSMNLSLPDLPSQSSLVRTALGDAYEAAGRGQWRDCFRKASAALETAAKRHLVRELNAGRVAIAGPGRPVEAAAVRRMTMGQLATAYRRIRSPTHRQAAIGSALTVVYRDRNLATHHEGAAAAERALRQNVGNHMWVIVNAMAALYRRP